MAGSAGSPAGFGHVPAPAGRARVCRSGRDVGGDEDPVRFRDERDGRCGLGRLWLDDLAGGGVDSDPVESLSGRSLKFGRCRLFIGLGDRLHEHSFGFKVFFAGNAGDLNGTRLGDRFHEHRFGFGDRLLDR